MGYQIYDDFTSLDIGYIVWDMVRSDRMEAIGYVVWHVVGSIF